MVVAFWPLPFTCDPRDEVDDAEEGLLVDFLSQDEEEEEDDNERVVLMRSWSSRSIFFSTLPLLFTDNTGDLKEKKKKCTVTIAKSEDASYTSD